MIRIGGRRVILVFRVASLWLQLSLFPLFPRGLTARIILLGLRLCHWGRGFSWTWCSVGFPPLFITIWKLLFCCLKHYIFHPAERLGLISHFHPAKRLGLISHFFPPLFITIWKLLFCWPKTLHLSPERRTVGFLHFSSRVSDCRRRIFLTSFTPHVGFHLSTVAKISRAYIGI